MEIVAPHWSELLAREWPWAHFSPRELASRGDGSVRTLIEAGDALESVRQLLGRPLRILSAYRDPLHNARVGGAPLSRHKTGRAFDIALASVNRFELAHAVADCGFAGLGRYQMFLHVDIRKRPAAWWGGERSEELWRS